MGKQSIDNDLSDYFRLYDLLLEQSSMRSAFELPTLSVTSEKNGHNVNMVHDSVSFQLKNHVRNLIVMIDQISILRAIKTLTESAD